MISKALAFLVLSVIAILIAPLIAVAQEVADKTTVVHFDSLIAEFTPYLLAFFGAVITAAITWATKKLSDWTGITIEANHREALQSALMNGARYAVAKATPNGVKVDLRNAALASGVKFVIDSVPDAVKYFGLTPEDLERHLAPKVSAVISDK
ncbi:hypothetical protein ABE527_02225 [Brucella sp. TWI432]